MNSDLLTLSFAVFSILFCVRMCEFDTDRTADPVINWSSFFALWLSLMFASVRVQGYVAMPVLLLIVVCLAMCAVSRYVRHGFKMGSELLAGVYFLGAWLAASEFVYGLYLRVREIHNQLP